MTAPSTAVTTPKRDTLANLPPEVQARLAENKMKNQVAAQIRGTIWGKDLSPEGVRAVAEYCRENGIDPVRHVEVLGGRIYLTAELYEERGAPLMQAGLVRKEEPDYINADERLDKLAAAGDEWAKNETLRRIRERIRWNAPEAAKAIVVTRLHVKGMENPLIGVNWCGGTAKRDPVGDAEPTKTAASRSARRAWKQIVEVIPSYGHQFERMHATMEPTQEILLEERKAEIAAPAQKAIGASTMRGTDDYGEPEPEVVTDSREPGADDE